jgi:cation:H+ antiporter
LIEVNAARRAAPGSTGRTGGRRPADGTPASQAPTDALLSPLVSIWLQFAACVVLIGLAGPALRRNGDVIAEKAGLSGNRIGLVLLASATSLPELVVTVAALRIGAPDMAIANLLGSNLFDMAIVAIDDLLYAQGPILSRVSIHAVSAMSAVVMIGIVIVGLLSRPRMRVFRTVGWASLGTFTMYLLDAYVLYIHGE